MYHPYFIYRNLSTYSLVFFGLPVKEKWVKRSYERLNKEPESTPFSSPYDGSSGIGLVMSVHDCSKVDRLSGLVPRRRLDN